MKTRFNPKLLVYCLLMLALILDSRAGTEGASQGIALCIQVVIPALLPMMVISSLITGNIYGKNLRILNPIYRFCGVPKDAGGLLLVGLLGGYPLGAKAVAESYRSGRLSKESAERMLHFVSNCGPAFLFGMCSKLFSESYFAWCIWAVHILSAILTARLLPKLPKEDAKTPAPTQTSLTKAIAGSVKTMGLICGWIICMRVLISFLERWLLWGLPQHVSPILIGILELTNGICNLGKIPNDALRFVVCCCLISFGGLCVMLQTSSVTEELGIRPYLAGKLMQTAITAILASIFGGVLFANSKMLRFGLFAAVFSVLIGIIFRKSVAFFKGFLYNSRKTTRGILYDLS